MRGTTRGARAVRLVVAAVCLAGATGCSWLLGVSEDPVFDPAVLAPDGAEGTGEAGEDASESPPDAGEEDAGDEPLEPEDGAVDE